MKILPSIGISVWHASCTFRGRKGEDLKILIEEILIGVGAFASGFFVCYQAILVPLREKLQRLQKQS
jgi:hypothetical protein